MLPTLELEESYPIGISSKFNNQVIELADSRNLVYPEWGQPLKEFELSKVFFDQVHLDYLVNFFDANSGQTFLYRDPVDHFAHDFFYEPEPGILLVGELFPLSATEYQLCKVYIADHKVAVRVITRPENTPEFRIDIQSAYSINWDTGRITFQSPPQATAIKWRGYFLTPVRTALDEQTYQIESNNPSISVPGLSLREFRESNLNFTPHHPQFINQPLSLDLIVGSQITKKKKISPIYTDSGWQKSLPLWNITRTSYRTARKEKADLQMLEAIDALWRVTLGGAIGFRYEQELVRCRSESLNLTVVSQDLGEVEPLELFRVNSSLLDSLDSQTYLVPLVDSSGSMDNDIPQVVSTIEQLRPIAQEQIYNGSPEATAKYFKEIHYLGDERWVEWLSRDFRDNRLNEANKVVFLIWINESSSVYHGSGDVSPTHTYEADLATFLRSYPNRDIFSAVIYAVNFAGTTFLEFQQHLIAAHEGTSGHQVALEDYGVKIYPDVPANSPPAFYLADLTGSNNQAVQFYCRAWSIEKSATQIPAIADSASTLAPVLPVMPQQPQQDLTDFAYLFGTYRSTYEGGLFGRDCGDLGYWRSKVPVKGRLIVIDTDDDQITVRLGDGTADKTGLIPISDAEYAEKTTIEFSDSRKWLRYSLNCVYNDSLPNRYGKDLETTDIIPLAGSEPTEIVYTQTIFRLGQCQTSYGFTCKWRENGVENVSSISGVINGPVTTVEVYVHDFQYIALRASNNSGVTEQILIHDQNLIPLTYHRAIGGIYDLTAVRLDSQPDDCGSLFGLDDEAIEVPAAVLGFTNHDTKFNFDGIEFLPQFGGNAQGWEYTEEIDRSNTSNITLILDDGAIAVEDLQDGVYEGAKFTEWLVNWNTLNRRKLATGYIGKTTINYNQYGGLDCRLEMRSTISRLQQKKFFITVRLCPKKYGGQELGGCRKNLFGEIDNVEITAIIDPVTLRISSNRTVANYYGEITLTSGQRVGVTRLVDSYDPATATLKLRSSISKIVVGDKLRAIAKCDGDLQSCLDRDNEANHGGFPHVPGIDAVRRIDR